MTDGNNSGERIAKVLARAGVASRRDAERMIAEGRVAVNGRGIDSPALNVGPRDRITVDGAPLPEAEAARLWLYHKPPGLVTTARDEKGRPTVFDNLPEGMPRVMPVGRLDLNSEGLLLLTNDGALKRRLELPATGWLRRYRVRVHGMPAPEALERLRAGITVEGERFQGMSVTLDRQQGANAWLTVSLREGRNREIRRAMEAVGLVVNRLIRVGYGPFKLGAIAAGAVEEVRPKVLRDQLGLGADEAGGAAARGARTRAGKAAPMGGAKGAGDDRAGGAGDKGARGAGGKGARGAGDKGARGAGGKGARGAGAGFGTGARRQDDAKGARLGGGAGAAASNSAPGRRPGDKNRPSGARRGSKTRGPRV